MKFAYEVRQFDLPWPPVFDEDIVIEMPAYADPIGAFAIPEIHVPGSCQRTRLCVTYLVDPNEKEIDKRLLRILRNGSDARANYTIGRHLGTLVDNYFVFHVFDYGRELST